MISRPNDPSELANFPEVGESNPGDVPERGIIPVVSDLAEVTNSVLRDAISQPGKNSMCFGISEKSLDRFIRMYLSYHPGPNRFIKYKYLGILIYRRHDDPLDVKVVAESDGKSKKGYIRVTMKLHLGTMSPDWDPTNIPATGEPKEYAHSEVTIEVKCEPGLLEMEQAYFNLLWQASMMIGEPVTTISKSGWTIIQKEWPTFTTYPHFYNHIKEKIDNMVKASGDQDFKAILPQVSYVVPLPDYHDSIKNYELDFTKLDYRTVTTDGKKLGYLYHVWSVRSLNFPAPCNCPDKAKYEAEPERIPAGGDGLQYEWCACGFSQEALREIFSPYLVGGYGDSAETQGTVYGKVKYWWRYEMREVGITASGVYADIAEVGAGGSAKAAVRDCKGHDIVSASASLKLEVLDSKISWKVEFKKDSLDSSRTNVFLIADAHLGPMSAEIEADPIPPPINQIASWITTTASEKIVKPRLEKEVEDKAHKELFYVTRIGNRWAGMEHVGTKFFQNQAMVIIGRPMIDYNQRLL